MKKQELKVKFQAIKTKIDQGIAEAKSLKKKILALGDKIEQFNEQAQKQLKEKEISE
jgi:hypothetical protein